MTVVAIGTSLPELATSIRSATIVLGPIIWNGFRIRRWEGVVLVGLHAVYVAYLLLDANGAAADVVGPAALIVAPLVLLRFAVTGVQGWRRHRASGQEPRTADPEPFP